MGLGKTVSTLTAIHTLIYEELEIDTVLVVAPKRVAVNVWTQEAASWEHLKDLTISVIDGDVKKRTKALKAKADIYTIGRDNIAWLCGLYGGSSLPFSMLVVDELSSFKNPSSVRFKALRKVQASFARVVGLTGTPSPNGLLDLWSQIYLLDRGQRLEKYVEHYKSLYFKPDKRNGTTIFSYKPNDVAEKAIFNRIKDICLSMSAKDYLKLPERIVNTITIPMGSALAKQYAEFEEEKILEIFFNNDQGAEVDPDVEIGAVNAGVLTNKLLQFCNGAIYDEDRNVHEIHKLKIEETKELIEEANGNPVLIGYTYKHDRDRLLKALKKYKPTVLDKPADFEAWNRGEVQVALLHPASGGHGLNLQAGGSIIIWFGQTWSLELEQQFNARLHRQGQTKSVIIHKLILEGTMDEAVMEAIKRKAGGQEALMEAVKNRLDLYAG